MVGSNLEDVQKHWTRCGVQEIQFRYLYELTFCHGKQGKDHHRWNLVTVDLTAVRTEITLDA